MGVGGVLYHGHGYKKKKTTGPRQHEHLHDVGSDNTKEKRKNGDVSSPYRQIVIIAVNTTSHQHRQ
jgi:hypothetical protein